MQADFDRYYQLNDTNYSDESAIDDESSVFREMEEIDQKFRDAGLGELWDQYYIARSELNAARNKAARPAVAPFTAYFNTAGEVESRNVQRRLNMTAEERQNSLLSETEDVAEESKIYLFEGGESLMAEPFTEDQKRQILALAPRSGVDVVHKILYGGSITRNGNTIHFDGKNSHALKLHLNAPGFHPRRGPVTLEEIEKYLPLALAQEPKIETKKNKKGKRSSNKIYKFTDGKITYTLVTASRGGGRSFYSNKKAANAVTDLDRSSATGMLHDNNIPQNPENASDTDNNLRFSVAPDIDTPAFKDWFMNSKVVDQDGKPLVVYRRDDENFTVFDFDKTQKTDAGWLGKGFYFYGDQAEAERAYGYGKNLRSFYLKAENPYYISQEEYNELVNADDKTVSAEFTQRLIEDGYDSVYWNGDLRQEWVVFEPTQIKSATDNVGTFDPANPDIRFSVANDDGIDPEIRQAFPRYQSSQAKDILKKIARKDLKNIETGIDAQISRNQRGKLFSNNATNKSKNNGFTYEQHIEAVANIQDLYKNAVLIKNTDDKKNNDPNVKIYRFASPFVVKIEDRYVIADALLTVKESIDKNSKRIYSLELTEIIMPQGQAVAENTDYSPSGIDKLQQKHEKIKQFLEKNQENIRFSVAEEERAQRWAEILLPVVSSQHINLEWNFRYLREKGVDIDPVRDDRLLRNASATAQLMIKERRKAIREKAEENELRRKDPFYAVLSARFGSDFLIDAGLKYDATLFTGNWIDKHKTMRGKVGTIPAVEAAKILTESLGREVTAEAVVDHFRDLKRSALLAEYRTKR